MYEPPINIFTTTNSIVSEFNKETDSYILKSIHNLGIDVNKDDLIKAMNYDRDQYQKGYTDGQYEGLKQGSDAAVDTIISLLDHYRYKESDYITIEDAINIIKDLKWNKEEDIDG